MIRVFAAVRAVITAAVVLAGPPLVLLMAGGNPLPETLPSAGQVQAWLDDPLQPRYAPGTARVVGWLIWAVLAGLTLTAGAARARRWRWSRLTMYLPGPVQGLAATVLGAATVATTVGVPAHAAPATTGDTAAPHHIGPTKTAAVPAGADQRPQAAPRVTVRPGDTLWDIAGNRLGDPQRWKQIYRLNTARHPHMHGGDHIEPGWTLTLPTRAVPPDDRPAPSGTAHSASTATPAGTAPATAATPQAPSTRQPDTAAGQLAGASPAPPDDTRTRSDVPPTRRAPADGLTLPGGSWLDLGLASAIAAAAALVWALRRRRYRPHPPSAQLRLDDPDMTPMPPVVDQIRRRLRRLTDGGGTEHITSAPPIKRTEPIQHVNIVDVAASAGSPVEGDAAVAGPSGSRPDDQPCDEDLETGDEDPSQYDQAFQGHDGIGMGDQPTAQPTYPSLTHPMIAIWPPAGLGLTGAGAHAAARGMLTAALAAGGVDTPGERSRVIMTSAAMTTLLGEDTTTQAPTPRLTVTAGIDEALALLEEQLLHRSRLLYAHEVDTLAEMRVADPTEEPLPPVMLLAESGDRDRRTRVAALLAQGRRLDIHGVLLGAWPDGNTLLVAPDGTTSPADGDSARDGAHPADIGRLAVLTPDETSDLLRILAESHTGQQSTTAAAEPAVITTGDSHARTAGGYHQPDTGQARPAPPAASSPQPAATGAAPELQEPDADNTNAASGAGVQPTHREPAQQTAVRVDASPAGVPGPDPAVAGPGGYRVGERRATEGADGEEVDETGASGCGARAQITVLGTAGIAGLPVGIAPRKKSLEALVYLAVHDGEATAEAILDDVLGDAPASKASGRLYTYISDLRTVLRRVAGHATYISHPGQRYVLDHDLVDVDLWRMQAAIRDAALAADPQQRQSALRRAVDTYAGPLADGADYEWIEPYREAVRQQALDAALALAGTLAETPAEQIAVLDTAIRHHPYTEQLYQQAMRTRARLGHLDAIRTLRRAVTRALDEIDAEPTDDTIALADELVSQLQRTNHPRSPRAPRPAEGAAA